jgi:hypothetical protein
MATPCLVSVPWLFRTQWKDVRDGRKNSTSCQEYTKIVDYNKPADSKENITNPTDVGNEDNHNAMLVGTVCY